MMDNMVSPVSFLTKSAALLAGFECLFENCMPQAIECGKDFSCLKSLACIIGCGEDELGCNLNCEIR